MGKGAGREGGMEGGNGHVRKGEERKGGGGMSEP